MVNMNDFAREITLEEGGAKSVNIAQVKEIVKLTLEKLAKMGTAHALALIKRHR